MKRTKLFIVFTAAIFLAGCATKNPTEEQNPVEEVESEEIFIDEDEVEDVYEVISTISEADIFFDQIKNIDLIIQSSPKRTSVGKAFDTPYKVLVKDINGNPVSGFGVTVSWPVSRTKNAVVFNSADLISDKDGIVIFDPGKIDFPAFEKVTFYPTPSSSDPEITNLALGAAVEADWEVRSTMIYKTGVLFVYDCNEKGTPTANSTAILTEFRNRGISAGNAPISDSSYLSKSVKEIYNANKEILDGSGIAFLIISKVEFIKNVYQENGEQVCELKAAFTCVDMKNGNELFVSEVSNKASGKTYWQAVENCKAGLATKFVDAVMYGM